MTLGIPDDELYIFQREAEDQDNENPDAPPRSLKIVQILIAPNDSTWQGALLGLGEDGHVYEAGGTGWEPYFECKLSRGNDQGEAQPPAKNL